MSFELQFSRRQFIGGALALGSVVLLDGCGQMPMMGASDAMENDGIIGGADASAVAVRMDPPDRPVFAAYEAGEFIDFVPNDLGYVSFTLDDGPGTATHEVLDIFQAAGLEGKAGFAQLASAVEQNPEAGIETVERGYEIISHGYNHNYASDGPNAAQIGHAEEVFGSIYGFAPSLYRAPSTVNGPNIRTTLRQLDMAYISTNQFVGDYQAAQSGEQTYNAVTGTIRSGTIVLIHEIVANTRRVLPAILEKVLELGLIPVRPSELLQLRYNEDGTRKPEYPVKF